VQARPAKSAAQKRSQEAFEDSGDISIKINLILPYVTC